MLVVEPRGSISVNRESSLGAFYPGKIQEEATEMILATTGYRFSNKLPKASLPPKPEATPPRLRLGVTSGGVIVIIERACAWWLDTPADLKQRFAKTPERRFREIDLFEVLLGTARTEDAVLTRLVLRTSIRSDWRRCIIDLRRAEEKDYRRVASATLPLRRYPSPERDSVSNTLEITSSDEGSVLSTSFITFRESTRVTFVGLSPLYTSSRAAHVGSRIRKMFGVRAKGRRDKGSTYAACANGARCVAGSSATVAARRAKLQEAAWRDLMASVESRVSAPERNRGSLSPWTSRRGRRLS
ncbi:hypothetical protein KM043_016806 [Ampulex compressa]|nr:hypothetical protein KM043_016806 [Ampulex compressa]